MKAQQVELGLEQKAILQEAIQQVERAMELLESLQVPQSGWLCAWHSREKRGGEGLITTYRYLLSLPVLESWHIPSWGPHAGSFERDVKRLQKFLSEMD
jgi:hypothetical protein